MRMVSWQNHRGQNAELLDSPVGLRMDSSVGISSSADTKGSRKPAVSGQCANQ
jgi:hypothetical protein